MKREHDAPRPVKKWIIELETDPEEFEYTAFALEDGEGETITTECTNGKLTHEHDGPKLYVEIVAETDVTFSVGLEVAYRSKLSRNTLERGYTVSVDEGDELWFDLRPGTARWGVETNP